MQVGITLENATLETIIFNTGQAEGINFVADQGLAAFKQTLSVNVEKVKLDEFLRISEREVLNHAGSVSHEQALQKAEIEFEKYRQSLLNETSTVERHFEEAVKKLELLALQQPKSMAKPEGKGRGKKK